MTPERIEQLRKRYERWSMGGVRDAVIVECLDEIERLRTQLNEATTDRDAWESKALDLRSAINRAIAHAAGRADEWGERAEHCFEILEDATR